MLNKKVLEQINDNIKLLSKDFSLVKDMEENLKSILFAVIGKLNLVTRDEFDIQQKVLLATRKKLDEIEKLLNKE